MAGNSNKPRLGKGLSSIFGEGVETVLEDIEKNANTSGQSATEIAIEEIRPNPYQPRKTFDPKALKELSESIKEHGVFTPVILRKSVQGYELIAGERRLRAAKEAGLKTIPAITVDFDDQQMMEVSILENIQREDLNPIEEASAYQKLMESFNYTQEMCAERVGKTREYIANILRLLKLPESVRDLVKQNKISMSAVRPLVVLENEEDQYDIAMKIIDEGLSVRQVEQLVREVSGKAPTKKKAKSKTKDPNLTYVENLMELKLQTRVEVEKKTVTIHYTSDKDLNRILEIMGLIEE